MYKINLPNMDEVDIFNLPEDFDKQVLSAFARFTKETSKDYRDDDRLYFMDRVIDHLNNDTDCDDDVDKLVKSKMHYQWDEFGELLSEDDIYCVEFMTDCCSMGRKYSRLYNRHNIKNHHIYDELNKIKARIMKIVSNATEEQIKEMQVYYEQKSCD